MKGSEVEKEVCAYAEGLGFMSIKFKDLNRAGGPDRMFISKMGNVMFMEFKGETESISSRQKDYIMDLKNHCAWVNIVRDFTFGTNLLNELRKKDDLFGVA